MVGRDAADAVLHVAQRLERPGDRVELLAMFVQLFSMMRLDFRDFLDVLRVLLAKNAKPVHLEAQIADISPQVADFLT